MVSVPGAPIEGGLGAAVETEAAAHGNEGIGGEERQIDVVASWVGRRIFYSIEATRSSRPLNL